MMATRTAIYALRVDPVALISMKEKNDEAE